MQRELLVSLFLPESLNKLHDGAVVIRNLRIAKAGVFFPMPDTKILDKSLGSRHRAALGITEETDAVVVVVSEERGTISFCFNGNIVTNLDGASLRQALLGLFGQSGVRKRGEADREAHRDGDADGNGELPGHVASGRPRRAAQHARGRAAGSTGSVRGHRELHPRAAGPPWGRVGQEREGAGEGVDQVERATHGVRQADRDTQTGERARHPHATDGGLVPIKTSAAGY